MALFNHGSPTVTTAPARLIAANVGRIRSYVLVRASFENTAKIYVGSSAAVNGTLGDPNCGWPLDPGEAKEFEVNESVDAGDETDIWAVAASGTQYAHVESK